MNNTKKLLLYSLDCIKATAKNSVFNNIKGSKENKIIVTDSKEFESDNKEIIEIMTKYALNKTTMGIYAGAMILDGTKGKDNFYSPVLYTDAELVRDGDRIRLVYDEDGMSINVGLIASLLDNNEEKIENIINDLLNIENVEKIDFKKVLSGLINLDNLTIKDEKSVILAKIPESLAGLINELKLISELY